MAKLGEMLVAEGLVTKEQLDAALERQRKDGGFLGAILVAGGSVSEPDLANVLKRQPGHRTVKIDEASLDPELAEAMPAEIAKKFSCVPIKRNGNVLTVAILDPGDDRAVDSLGFLAGKTIKAVAADAAEIREAQKRLYNGAMKGTAKSAKIVLPKAMEDVNKAISGVIDDVKGMETAVVDEKPLALAVEGDDAPVIRLVNGLIAKSIQMRASDIHFEPFEGEVRVRFRIDGVMSTVYRLPSSIKTSLVARIKIMSKLDITEHRFPQDGRIKVQMGEDAPMDMRISTLPSLFGEKVVMRLLGGGNLKPSLEALEMPADGLEQVRGALEHPHGMVLVTGPTGSGKTTTLYTFLQHLNKEDVNIVTAEDPVEYNLGGITQVPVRPSVGYTFDLALRAFLRQDPDVILVGEMRDYETAAIAVKAALTGHLVLSTLHTNDAPSTTVRLIDMGIEPYLVASAVKIVIAQRLVRRVCPTCREEVALSDREKAGLTESVIEVVQKSFRGKGCVDCANTGYRGRAPVFEAMPVRSKEMKRIITEAGTEVQVAAVARREGVRTLKEEAIRLVTEGVTTVEEAMGIIAAE